MSDETSPAGNGWTFITHNSQRVPVHCGRQAFDLDLGEWECAICDAPVHVRQITGWHAHSGDRTGSPGS